MPMSKNKQIGGSLVRALSVLCVALGAASVAAGAAAGEVRSRVRPRLRRTATPSRRSW